MMSIFWKISVVDLVAHLQRALIVPVSLPRPTLTIVRYDPGYKPPWRHTRFQRYIRYYITRYNHGILTFSAISETTSLVTATAFSLSVLYPILHHSLRPRHSRFQRYIRDYITHYNHGTRTSSASTRPYFTLNKPFLKWQALVSLGYKPTVPSPYIYSIFALFAAFFCR